MTLGSPMFSSIHVTFPGKLQKTLPQEVMFIALLDFRRWGPWRASFSRLTYVWQNVSWTVECFSPWLRALYVNRRGLP